MTVQEMIAAREALYLTQGTFDLWAGMILIGGAVVVALFCYWLWKRSGEEGFLIAGVAGCLVFLCFGAVLVGDGIKRCLTAKHRAAVEVGNYQLIEFSRRP